jgi:hypothetical protein
MVLNIEPISNILPFAINRQRFVVYDVINKKRNELFGKLVTTVIV